MNDLRNQSQRQAWITTHEYSSHGIRYVRLAWGRGRSVFGYAHINGGSASTKVVQARRAAVDRMIAEGRSLQDILDAIRLFPNEPAGRKKF